MFWLGFFFLAKSRYWYQWNILGYETVQNNFFVKVVLPWHKKYRNTSFRKLLYSRWLSELWDDKKNHWWVPNECMHVHVYIYRVTERQGHKMWNQSDIICQPPFVLCPYIQQLPKSLMRHRQLFHYQLISYNVLIRIWSALTGYVL